MKPGNLFITLLKASFMAPFYVLYGAWSLLRFAGALATRGLWIKRLSAAALGCPSCGHPNRLHGRWTCAACSAVYHGFVGECALCHAGASMMFCERCGVSIALGGRP